MATPTAVGPTYTACYIWEDHDGTERSAHGKNQDRQPGHS